MGHLLPLVPFLDEVRKGGGRTLVVGPPFLEGMVRTTGHAFLALGDPPKELRSGAKDRSGVLLHKVLAVMERTVQEWRPDLILREPDEYISAWAAAELGVAVAQVATSLAGHIWESIDKVAPVLDAFWDGFTDELRCSPFLTRLPTSLDASPFPANRRYREPLAGPRGALPAWWPDSRAPLVYVTFGTVVARGPLAGVVYPAVIDAVARLDARVLVTVGDFDMSQLGDVPANVHVEAWVDQADVLGEARLVVCHGGSGTVYGALAAGVPLVVMPIFGDQPANASAVARARVGIEVETGPGGPEKAHRRPINRDDAPRIRELIETVLTDGSYRQAAREVSAEMAMAPTIGTLLGQLVRRY